ncbi:hypothetical protein AB7645_39895 [Bradyrhizobium sp. 956_D2_N1_5]|uniref:hypothetical protein n=1 Tax=unclassified Bradyrhizobium TaxID=2631580 RepID=UPI003F2232BF
MSPGPTDVHESDLHRLRIRFDGLSIVEANKAAKDLERVLHPLLGSGGSVELTKTDTLTQDFGTTLIVVLGTPAAIAVAKGIHDFVAKRGNRVVIETDGGSVLATGDAAANIDIAKTVDAIRKG